MNGPARTLCTACLLLSCLAPGAPGAPTFGPTAELTSEGLAFQVFRQARTAPLPQPTVYHYRSSTGGISERFDPRDIWYRAMYRGRWQDPAGNSLVIGRVGVLFPRDKLPPGHVSREDYDRALASANSRPPANETELAGWAGDFAENPVKGAPRPLRGYPRLARILKIEFEPADRPRLGYAFQMTRNAFGVDPDQWFLALFELPRGADRVRAAHAIERDFLSSLTPVAQAPDPSAETSRPFRTDALPPRTEPAGPMAESRERAISSIRGVPGWWYVETPDYLLVANLPESQRVFVRQLQHDLETVREAFERILPPRQPVSAVSLVRIFAGEEEYVRYVGPESAWTGGLWMPAKRELVIRSPEGARRRETRERIAATVFHEAWHQYLFYALNLLQASPWFNEGMATFFEGTDIRNKELRILEAPHYAKTMEELATQRRIDLPRLLMMDYDGFYLRRGGTEQQRLENYARAWGLMYYLIKGAPLEQENDYETIPQRYVDALWQLRNEQEATRHVFSRIDMQAFAENVRRFWLSRARRGAARRATGP